MLKLAKLYLLLAIVGWYGVSSVPVPARVVCYWGNWNADGTFPPAQIPVDKCTHVIYSFIGMDTNSWTVTVGNPAGVLDFLNIRNRNPNVKLLVAAGGGSVGGGPYSDMASVQSRRATYIGSLVAFMNQYAFDGLDMDWEYPGVVWTGGRPEDKVNFVTFMQELRAAFNSAGRGWEISMAVTVVPQNLQDGYDMVQLCQLVDRVHIMTYDMHGRWEAFVDVHSPLYPRAKDGNIQLNTEDGALSWNNGGCPRYKIIVGVPFYGHQYVLQEAGQNGLGAASNVEATNNLPDDGNVKYSAICSLVNGGGWTRGWDAEGRVPYAYSGANWIGYEDLESLQLKLDYIQNQGYGGTMVWSIDQDDFGGNCGPTFPLVTAIHNAMKDYYAEQ